MTAARIPLLLIGVLLFGAAQSSCAPKARQIRGEIAEEIQQGIARGTEAFDHARFDALLRRYVDDENFRVDYRGLKQEEAELDAYLAALADVELRRLGRDELFALFLNAYNAYTLKTITETITPEQPDGVPSIRDIPNVFGRRVHRVGGYTLSLDNIEHNILRPIFRDPRIHFAVNCAAIGCPPLAAEAYTAARLDEQLDRATRRTLASPVYVRVENDRLLVTKVMDWYGGDFTNPEFTGAAGSLAEYIARYTRDEVRHFIEAKGGHPTIRFLDYDWSLNSAR